MEPAEESGPVKSSTLTVDIPPEPDKLPRQKEKATPAASGRNYLTSTAPNFGGSKTKYRANVQAIRMLQELEHDNRLATPQEQEILAQYAGWGGLPQVFDAENSGWAKEYAELRALLDDEEYESARASTPNAHYTSPTVIRSIYTALECFGFTGGRILEPSLGAGYFFANMPQPIMKNSKLFGVELDSISGRLSQQLYQDATIKVQGFETTNFPDNYFDVAVGNVPFGSYQVADEALDKYHFLIHDYFFAKAISKVRPGGFLVFVTSKGTLDKGDSTLRRYMAQRADLIGAIRLPNNAFKEVANTQVTTDILFFQKRAHMTTELPDWLYIGKDENDIPVNEYFLAHPEMMLGTMVMDDSMYGGRKDTACIPLEGKPLEEQLDEAVSQLSAQMTAWQPDEDMRITLPADPNVRNFTYTIVDNELYYRQNDEMVLCSFSDKDTQRLKGMHDIRLAVLDLLSLQQELCSDETLDDAQQRLSGAYDAFVHEFGLLSDRQNSRLLREDNDACLLSALECKDKQGQVSKADIFTKRIIKPAQLVTQADNAQDALTLCINNCRTVDFSFLQRVYPKSEDAIIAELGDSIFLDPAAYQPDSPYTGWTLAEEYLSGNVREKLAVAKLQAEQHPDLFSRNVAALEKIQPKELEASEIEVRLGAAWLKPAYIDAFLYELLDTPRYLQGDTPNDLHTVYSRYDSSWTILNAYQDRLNPAAVTTYGTQRKTAYEIVEDTLNLRSVVVKDAVDDGNGGVKYVTNHKQTMIARGKQEIIKSEFRSWIFKDPERRRELVAYYNAHFNSTVNRQYDGSRLLLPGINPLIQLRPHQLNAVARCISGKNALLAHVVGAGKTYTMIAAAHEQLRLGLASKCAFVVPNHLTEQFGSDILELYPSAKVLISTKIDFEKSNRQKFLSRIAMSDVDYVVIGHTQFEKIPLSPDFQQQEIERQVEEISFAIADSKRQKGERYSVKQLESRKKGLQTQLRRLNSDSKKDKQITFEQLGINSLFVDEAHYYKNLAIFSKMRNVAGISNTHAQKASDMLMKTEYMASISGIVTFATGTPLSNSMAELFVMQKYLQNETLQQCGIYHFDEWAAMYGETVTAMELAPEGNGHRPRTRFARFVNLPELMTMFREVADIQTADMLDLPRPKLAGGKPAVVKCRPSEALKTFMVEGLQRVEDIRNGSVHPTVDNMLKFTTDAKKAGLDMRLIVPLLENDPEGKISQCVERVLHHYKETQAQRGTQLVFCDTSTPKKDAFDVYTEFKRQAVDAGIPADEIAFIHDASTDRARDELFAKCRSGEVRVLLGSTQKCGAGTNIQDRMIALHHLDCPYRPSDIEQREGRIWRQGNMWDEVYIYRYVTEKSFDAYLWSIVENKARFIAQIMTSKTPARTCEDMDEAVLSYAEVKAIASGDPRIKEKMEVDMEVTRLLTLKNEYSAQQYRLEDLIQKQLPDRLQQTRLLAQQVAQDIALLQVTQDADFSIRLGSKTFTEREPAGERLIALASAAKPGVETPLGGIRGFGISIYKGTGIFDETEIRITGSAVHTAELSVSALGSIARIENTLKGIPDRLERIRKNEQSHMQELEKCKTAYAHPFTQEGQLKEQLAHQARLAYELEMNKDNEIADDGDTDAAAPAEEGESMMTIVVVPPGMPAYEQEISGNEESMQRVVGGPLLVALPFTDETALVCNANGKRDGFPPSRSVDGEIIAGTFFICGYQEGALISLDEVELARHMEKWARPEKFSMKTAPEVSYADPVDY